jgi:hypothetical protein
MAHPYEISVALQTLYADLVERAWMGDISRLVAGVGGSPVRREISGKGYWYWQEPTPSEGKRSPLKYLGRDTDEMRARIEAMQGSKVPALKERRYMVRALRAARFPVPDELTGEVMAALASAGAFRLRAVVVGSVAFQCYSGLLGVRIPASLGRTGDLDVGQFPSIAMAVDDEVAVDFLIMLKQVDPRFEAIPDPFDSRRTLKYVVRSDGEVIYAVDVLAPLRGPERGRLTYLKALRTHAQLLRYLDFLLYQEVNAVVLHGPGIPVNVPAPERYALHKLLISQLRAQNPRSQAKANKDRQQAIALIEILRRQRPFDVTDAWNELLDRGPSWRQKASRGFAVLPSDIQGWILAETAPEFRANVVPKQ